MDTIGSQASGLTGLKIWISGFIAALAVFDRPARMPSGTAITVPMMKPKKTVLIEVQICCG